MIENVDNRILHIKGRIRHTVFIDVVIRILNLRSFVDYITNNPKTRRKNLASAIAESDVGHVWRDDGLEEVYNLMPPIRDFKAGVGSKSKSV